MKYFFLILFHISSNAHAKLTISEAQKSANKYQLGSYNYHQKFLGHNGYAAPLILTSDGGFSVFGDSEDKSGKVGLLVKVSKAGKEDWQKSIRPKFMSLESQSVIQDKLGGYFIFMLSYEKGKSTAGCERVIYLNKSGKLLWDKLIGKCEITNSPTFAYIHLLNDGRLSLRGQVVVENPAKGKDPVYRFWEGLMDNKGTLTEKTGDVINWSNKDWEDKFKPE